MKDIKRNDDDMLYNVQIYCENRDDIPDVIAKLSECDVDVQARTGAMFFEELAPAIIVTGANVLIAVIGGLFSYIQAKHSRTIHIKGTDGFQVTVPADTSPEELDRLIKLATERRADRLVLTESQSGYRSTKSGQEDSAGVGR
ncbi:MAG: hypothetical protein A2521_07145 [Deltaproteobacteria bacterium RIFOXYD12_FULL_57_12]|nr:MAG: hypothetical protein A2521_07145 [Deltaproteobacteria bacterium RIFOXYD12_FULL_57_12]